MAVFGSERNEQTWNYNWQSWTDSNNNAFSSSRVLENVGNMSLHVGQTASSANVEKLIVGAVAGLLIIGGIKLLK